MKKKINKLKREHASFFNWHIKSQKEEGIIEKFLDKINHKGLHHYSTPSFPESDPPDSYVLNENNELVAIEITELVNKSAIDAQIHYKNEYWNEALKWSEFTYFEHELIKVIRDKENKCNNLFSKGETVDLLLHTDEVFLIEYHEELLENLTISDSKFNKIWLMLGYIPQKNCPVFKLWPNV